MTTTYKYFLVALALLLLWSGCEKSAHPQTDTEAPVLAFLAPAEGAVFAPGSSLTVRAEVSENFQLHDYQLSLEEPQSKFVIVLEYQHLHAEKHLIEKTFTLPNMSGVSTYDLVLEASDHDGNTAVLRRQLRVE